jgi:hypothetical protein
MARNSTILHALLEHRKQVLMGHSCPPDYELQITGFRSQATGYR